MRKLLFSLTASVVVISFAASADILNLTDPSGIPIPPGTHVDSYPFPTPLLNISNPITNLTIAYTNIAAVGDHEIMSATPLFDSAQVASITEVSSTPTYYEASAAFSVPVTAVSDRHAPAFWAVHGGIGGGFVYTELRWTASYSDGTERMFSVGIVPEPTSAALLALAGLTFLVSRQGRTSRCTE
jgi:hypothetical protein